MLEHLLPVASSYASDIDGLFSTITIVVGFWFLLVEATFFYLIFRFRKKDGQKAEYMTGDRKEHHRWISIPHALVILCDIGLIVGTIMVWMNVKQELPEPDLQIRIIGQQWAWIFVHPGPDGKIDTADDITTVDELHVVKDKTYTFKLESRDVVHSFSVPAFRLKQDAVPGREITGWFKPILAGEFGIQCAEICGIGHGIMGARLMIETEEEHNQWIKTGNGV